MPQTLSSLLGVTLILLVVLGAVLFGRGRARRAAAALGAGVIASVLTQRLSGAWSPAAGLAAVDGAVFLAFALLAHRPRRGWLLAAVALQGVTLALDLVKMARPALSDFTFLSAAALAGYGLTAAVAWGAWRSRREE